MADAQLPKWTDPRYQEKLAELWPHNASSDEFFKKDYRAKHDWHQSLTYEHWDYVEPFEFLEPIVTPEATDSFILIAFASLLIVFC